MGVRTYKQLAGEYRVFCSMVSPIVVLVLTL